MNKKIQSKKRPTTRSVVRLPDLELFRPFQQLHRTSEFFETHIESGNAEHLGWR